ncbi:MAG: metalloregulator ArsR/SmtB family transcription factor [Syntrophobacteria bacterium]|jgi:DNA-binding transcriptional ArsR family regulator
MESKQAELFKVLAVDSRIRIIELLKQKGPLGSNEMSEMLGITPSAVSQHLKILKHAGLVRNERKGYWIPYEIDPVALEKCGEFLSSVCTCGCEGTGLSREAELSKATDRVAMLRKYEQELQEELNKVQAEIEELKEEE